MTCKYCRRAVGTKHNEDCSALYFGSNSSLMVTESDVCEGHSTQEECERHDGTCDGHMDESWCDCSASWVE